jgi:hypothetical protein
VAFFRNDSLVCGNIILTPRGTIRGTPLRRAGTDTKWAKKRVDEAGIADVFNLLVI